MWELNIEKIEFWSNTHDDTLAWAKDKVPNDHLPGFVNVIACFRYPGLKTLEEIGIDKWNSAEIFDALLQLQKGSRDHPLWKQDRTLNSNTKIHSTALSKLGTYCLTKSSGQLARKTLYAYELLHATLYSDGKYFDATGCWIPTEFVSSAHQHCRVIQPTFPKQLETHFFTDSEIPFKVACEQTVADKFWSSQKIAACHHPLMCELIVPPGANHNCCLLHHLLPAPDFQVNQLCHKELRKVVQDFVQLEDSIDARKKKLAENIAAINTELSKKNWPFRVTFPQKEK